MKTRTLILSVACLVLVAAITLIIVQGTSAYTRYSDAFNNLPSTTKFLDLNTGVSVTSDGITTQANGNLQLDNDNTRLMYAGSLAGAPFTQFTDGSYMYLDYNGVKTKYQFGTASPMESTTDFSVDNYIRNYASTIDYMSVMQLGLLSKMSSRPTANANAQVQGMSRAVTADGFQYTAVLTDSARDALFNTVTAVQTNWTQKPDAKLNSLDYVMYTDAANIVKSIAVSLSFDVTFDATMTGGGSATKTVDMQINLSINSVNKALTVTVPAVDDFVPNFSTATPAPSVDAAATATAADAAATATP